MSSTPTTYFITGANRGIGLGLVSHILAHETNPLIFATARSPASATELNKIAEGSDGKVVVVKLESTSVEDAQAAAKLVEEKAGSLDVLIANAGIAKYYGPMETTPISEFEDHFQVNVIGPVILYQAFLPLLRKSPTGAGKFVPISSGVASLTDAFPLQGSAYFTSKTALNMIVRRAEVENKDDGLIAFALSPGWVATDMGNAGAKSVGMEAAPTSVEDSAAGIFKLVKEATAATHNGKFWSFDGTTYNW